MNKFPIVSVITLIGCMAFCALQGAAASEDRKPAWRPDKAAVGLGPQWRPDWLGSREGSMRIEPWFDIEWGDTVALSSDDGLTVDFLRGEHWHGGLAGGMQRGRSAKDLGELASKVHTLQNTLQGGVFLEYEWFRGLDAGLRLSHDIQGTGAAQAMAYVDVGVPGTENFEHGFRLSLDAMNASGMRRHFGVSQSEAAALGSSAWTPGAGVSRLALDYGARYQLSRKVAVGAVAEYARLIGKAGASPLVSEHGSVGQRYLQIFVAYSFD